MTSIFIENFAEYPKYRVVFFINYDFPVLCLDCKDIPSAQQIIYDLFAINKSIIYSCLYIRNNDICETYTFVSININLENEIKHGSN